MIPRFSFLRDQKPRMEQMFPLDTGADQVVHYEPMDPAYSPMDRIRRTSILWVDEGSLYLIVPWDTALDADIATIPGRTFLEEARANEFPLASLPDILALCARWGIPVDPVIAGLTAPPLIALPALVGLSILDDREHIRLQWAGYLPDRNDVAKRMVPGIHWDRPTKSWIGPISSIKGAVDFAKIHHLTIEDGLIEAMEAEGRQAQEMYEASYALDADVDVEPAMPFMPFQKAGVAYLTKVRRAILADSMGLGKSLSSMGALIQGNGLPAVVVCPNTLKLNWVQEAAKFFPHLKCAVVEGRKSNPIPSADLIICNYDIVADRAADIIATRPLSIVCDESHALKNGQQKYVCPVCNDKVRVNSKRCGCGAKFAAPQEIWTVKRAHGVMQIVRAIPDDGMILLLTGTPITNRPIELIPQLIAIGRIDDFGGRWRFKNRYCSGANGASNAVELNERLRKLCFIRRRKEDVYQELPPLQNVLQLMPVSDAAMKEYRRIESDVVEELAQRARRMAEADGEDGNKAYMIKKMRASAAEQLVRISVLKRAASDMKRDSAIQWIEQFLEDEDKLIVFAEHVDTVEEVCKHFGDKAVKVRGGVSNDDRMAAVDAFQNDPSVNLFVANMQAASEGLTLTAASHVAFLELGWTPAIHAQCAARCWGRLSDLHGATCHYILAAQTLDEDIMRLLVAKDLVVNAVTDGHDPDTTPSVLSDLVALLVSRGLGD